MNLTVKALDILFRCINPERILEQLFEKPTTELAKSIRASFFDMAETTLSGYSRDEQNNIYTYVTQLDRDYEWRSNLPHFFLLAKYGADVLSTTGLEPRCKYQEILNWREGYLNLGQDIIITAWLASRTNLQRTIESYAWPAIIHTNDPVMEQAITNLAENHMHLYAGASTFSLTWCCAMNHPEYVAANQEWMQTFLQMHISRGSQDNIWSEKRRLIYAAYIRQLLFQVLEGIQTETAAQSELQTFIYTYIDDVYQAREIKKTVLRLQNRFGMKFEQPKGRAKCLDYAFTGDLEPDVHKNYRIMASERYFLYRCFRRCFRGEFSDILQWAFYSYLLIKSQFRGELIQLNRQIGFHNFHDYDNRKYALWRNRNEYWCEDYYQAINATLDDQPIISLEGRLSPQGTCAENLDTLHRIDAAKLCFDAEHSGSAETIDKVKNWKRSCRMENMAESEHYYFVMHFAKAADTPPTIPNSFCRHENYRKELRKKSIALAKSLSASAYFCQRIRGIDACSNELHCRPEVFGQAFRFLREFPTQFYCRTKFSNETPYIRVTYHVGEDFMDIASGLRAIDEAICFLELQNGDRLGHAIALGVEPETHYATKSSCIVLSKQELLDNFVWMLFRSVELGVEIEHVIEARLRSKAQSLFNALYQPYCDSYTTIEDYYHSMLLRGDNPHCYRDGTFHEVQTMDPYDFFALCRNEAFSNRLWDYRNSETVTHLCNLYHYCFGIKRQGSEMEAFDVDRTYITLMGQFQESMQRYVKEHKISVECNPSSNVLIGTFGTYYKHPILRFNSTGLNLPLVNPQMHVSINSDDPGVFDTNLTFEYHLLAATLSQMTDEKGNRLHTDQAVKSYLQMIIRMGQEQCFGELPRISGRYR